MPGTRFTLGPAGGRTRVPGMLLLMRSRRRLARIRVLIWVVNGKCVAAPRYACRSGVRTTRPSSSAVTLIWQDRREFGRTS